MKVAVVGAGGMLGSVLTRRFKYDGFTKGELNIMGRIDVENLDLAGYDVVINCAGVPNDSNIANSYGVQILRENYTGRLIHISTDCVFSDIAVHASMDTPDPDSLYGAAKRLGELFALAGPASNTCVVRTSFVGPKHGLLPWFLKHKHGDRVQGWARAFWSGSTVDAVAEKINALVEGDERRRGIIHIATERKISKYKLLNFWNELFNMKLEINLDYEHEVHRELLPSTGYVLDPVTLRTKDFLDYKRIISCG